MKLCFLLVFLLVFPVLTIAEETEEEFECKTVIKTVDGLKFEVPEDRLIEKKNGIIMPMALDKYMAMKFSKMEARLQRIENSISKVEKNLKSVKEDIKAFKKANKILEHFY